MRAAGGSSGPRLAVVTLGCKVNQCESAFFLQEAVAAGWQAAAPETAEVVVVNSCTVTSRADRQVRQLLRQLGRRQPPPRLVVTGCYAQRAPGELAGFPGVQAVLGNAVKAAWPELLRRLAEGAAPWQQVPEMSACRHFQPLPLADFPDHARAFVKIQDGCDQHCAYCIVPQVRGPERSLPADQVLAQLRVLVQQGFREVVLTGINLSRWGREAGASLAALCRRLKEAAWPLRLRLSSLEPVDLTPSLLAVLADWPAFCPHFHIPLQSGSDEVLRAMGRPYRAAWFVELVYELARRFPTAAIGLDVMVGFPTETTAAYEQTRELVARLPLAYLHVFPYSPRPGTPAARLPAAASPGEVARWARDLRALAAEKKRAFYQRQVGKVVAVLAEGEAAGQPGWLTGLTDNYVRVLWPGAPTAAKQVVQVRLESWAGGRLRGTPCP